MRYRLPVDGTIGSKWGELRPLSKPVGERDHVHGALDIVAPLRFPIFAPADGRVFWFAIMRCYDGSGWKWTLKDGARPRMPWGQYSYDTYGGVAVLEDEYGLVHLLCHIYLGQLRRFSRGVSWSYQEQPEDARWPTQIWHTFGLPVYVEQGHPIGEVGNAGYSTGPHVHWEIHRGWDLTPHDKRPDPLAMLKVG